MVERLLPLHPSVTRITPPRLASFRAAWSQLEFSSRSLVFARDGAEVLRSWGDPDAPWILGVQETGSTWRVRAWGASAAEARAAARTLFSLDHPIEEFYRQVRADPTLRGTERRFRGLRLPQDPSVYEALLHSIVGQQLSVVAANTIKGRLLAAAESRVAVEGVVLPRVPTPDEMIALGPIGLRAVGLSRAKTTALLSLARRQHDGAFDRGALERAPREEAIERLDAEPGVGRWTAQNALLRGAGRTDMFVAGDLGVRVALDAYGALPRSAPEEEARAWAEQRFPGWGSYATLYLWRRLVADGAAAD
ncbi:MAG: hypothetical protein L3K17_00925 [Thermoplasmata archaeon]|nr:hypothetical protein [Thermoplasmata archaeon]